MPSWAACRTALDSVLYKHAGSHPAYMQQLSTCTAGVLAGKPCLQHLELTECSMLDAAGTAELMYYIEQLQELTHLNFSNSLKCGRVWVYPNPPAAAYSALTASSKLQHLDISGCTVPAGVWQKLFSPNKQLPHLRALHISGVRSGSAAAPDGSLLTSCCPGLQLLDMRDMRYSAEQLSPLAELSGLHELQLHPAGGSLSSPEGLEVVRQLTGLRRLTLWDPSEDAMLLQVCPWGVIGGVAGGGGGVHWCHRLSTRACR